MLISHGKWRDGISWEFHTGIIPRNELHNITAATVIIFSPDYKKVLLTFNTVRDQWELPGGHIEKNESVSQAAVREVFEEVGIHITDPELFAYRKVTDTLGTINKSTGVPYPMPSYVAYHKTVSNTEPLLPLTAKECSRAAYFDIENFVISPSDRLVITAAL